MKTANCANIKQKKEQWSRCALWIEQCERIVLGNSGFCGKNKVGFIII